MHFARQEKKMEGGERHRIKRPGGAGKPGKSREKEVEENCTNRISLRLTKEKSENPVNTRLSG